MHIPDGFLDPKVWGAASGVSAGFTGYALYVVRQKLNEKLIPMLGITAAFIFAAQMLNFPVAGGTSGHFLGATLACILLGAWPGFLVMVIVLLVQCLFFADGGLAALGANILNMGIVGGIFSHLIFSYIKSNLQRLIGQRKGILTSAAIASWLSVVLASIACSIELALAGTVPLSVAFPAMTSIHMLIGIGEAIITTVVLAVVMQARPDLVHALSGMTATSKA